MFDFRLNLVKVNMRLLILTSSPISANRSPQARLKCELEFMMDLNEITIVCLGQKADDKHTQDRYSKIEFLHCPAEYDGWSVTNADSITNFVLGQVKAKSPDLVVLDTEIWDLVREISDELDGVASFVTVFHAMPFLASPIKPSGDFVKDITEYTNSGIEEYRKHYILEHYEECEEVLKNVGVIASNKTVEYYFHKYFGNLKVWTQPQFLIAPPNPPSFNPNPEYDFAYMARMEKGKGVEYLAEILKRASSILGRKVKLVLAGKTEDEHSKRALRNLLEIGANNSFAEIKFLGWADDKTKRSMLSSSSVFLYPSHYDTYATVLNEAISSGLPCIVWELPYTKLNYEDAPAVTRVPIFDLEAFARSATDALSHRKSLFENVLHFIDQFDTPETMAKLDTRLLANAKAYLSYETIK